MKMEVTSNRLKEVVTSEVVTAAEENSEEEIVTEEAIPIEEDLEEAEEITISKI